jgi:hypothetical protein
MARSPITRQKLATPRDPSRGRHDDECGDRPLESPERDLADELHVDGDLDLGVETLSNQDLAGGRLVGEPRREIRNRSDRRVVGAPLEADLAAQPGAMPAPKSRS